MYHHGMPLDRLLAVYMGKIDDGRVPDGVRMLPRQQSVGAQLPMRPAWPGHRGCGGPAPP